MSCITRQRTSSESLNRSSDPARRVLFIRDATKLLIQTYEPKQVPIRGAFAELITWSLEPWHSYFDPYGSWITIDGKKAFAPAVDQIDEAIFRHWGSRVGQFRHPGLQALYADLCWELAKTVGNANPDFRHAVAAIDAYLEGLPSGLITEFYMQIASASRALDISLQVRDNNRSEAAIAMLLHLHDKAVAGEGWWSKTYDLLIADKELADDRRDHLARSLEVLAANYTDTANPDRFNPFQLENVAKRLQAYDNRVSARLEVVRLQETIGKLSSTPPDSLTICVRRRCSRASKMPISMPESQRMRSE